MDNPRVDPARVLRVRPHGMHTLAVGCRSTTQDLESDRAPKRAVPRPAPCARDSGGLTSIASANRAWPFKCDCGTAGAALPTGETMRVLGLNSAYHESSACVLSDGELLAFIEEERLNRIKHAKFALPSNACELPISSIDYCLEESGLTCADIDFIAFSIDPTERLARNVGIEDPSVVGRDGWGTEEGEQLFHDKVLSVVPKLSSFFGRDVEPMFTFVPHHLCHAYSTFFHSEYDRAAIIVVDGIGEFASTWIGLGEGTSVRRLYEIYYPNSLGFLWEKMSEYLGFDEYAAAKVMGLSSYGRGPNPRNIEDLTTLASFGAKQDRLSTMRSILACRPRGTFSVDNSVLRFRTNDFRGLETVFGVPKREPGTALTEDHMDIAAALQATTEETLLHLANEAALRTDNSRLCMSGGVALNCVANAAILESGTFDEVYIEPTANDAGTCIGAAFYVTCMKVPGRRPQPITTPYLGPEFSDSAVRAALQHSGLAGQRVRDIESHVAELLAQGNVVAWFQGRMEAGPRALGHRSILADPRDQHVREELNRSVKFREEFRPFCPSVLAEYASDWFEVRSCAIAPLRYMLATVKVKSDRRSQIPAVVHVDGTARIQIVESSECPHFWRLLDTFHRMTGIPMVLNTSFNIQEPIVCTPRDAIKTFKRSRLNFLAIADFIVTKES